MNFLDAAIRTIYRLMISRRGLLEWETAAATENRLQNEAWSYVWPMGAISIVTAVLVVLLPQVAWIAAMPILVAWAVSPVLAYIVSRPLQHGRRPLTDVERHALRSIARKTWSYFEAFVQSEGNWLPPDNFQEYPKGKIAHRLSPTNEGLFLMSALAARDFGYIGITDLVILLERNLAALDKLEMFHGHFLNWYDSTTLKPLTPRYVSSADSGNLAGCLLAVGEGLKDITHQPLYDEQISEGILDTLELVSNSLFRVQPRGARFVSEALTSLEDGLSRIRLAIDASPSDVCGWRRSIEDGHAAAKDLPKQLLAFEASIGLESTELVAKVAQLASLLAGLSSDAERLVPWTADVERAEGRRKRRASIVLAKPILAWFWCRWLGRTGP